VAISDDGRLYAADGYNDRVQVFSSNGQFLNKWGGPLALNIKGRFNAWFTTVSSLAIGPEGNVFTSDFYNNRVQKFTADGNFQSLFGEKGNGDGQLDRPLGIAVTSEGIVFVADFGNHRIQKWRSRLDVN
jgi:DNA-binding beta-propeller fold protein YncE